MELVSLAPDMFGFRLVEEEGIDPGWFVSHLRDIIQYHPVGCFALVKDGSPIGMITSTPYDRTGWLGWLYVKQSERMHGLGARLMRAGIDHLNERGVDSVILEAVVEAEPLYTRLGFRTQFHTQHFRLRPDQFNADTTRHVTIRRMAVTELETVTSFDRAYFHEDREGLFEIVLKNPTFSGYLAEHDGRVCGIVMLTRTTDNWQVSPMVVDLSAPEGMAIASSLISAAFGDTDLPLYFRCPLVDNSRQDPLVALGAEKVDYHTVRMVLGPDYPLERRGVLSLGCPGKG